MNINDYYQPSFRPSFPVAMLVTVAVIFSIAVLTGAFYKKEHRHEVAENMSQTLVAITAVLVVFGLCYYDGIAQLAANILRANTKTNMLYVDFFVASPACSCFALLVGAGYMCIKKISYKKLNPLVRAKM